MIIVKIGDESSLMTIVQIGDENDDCVDKDDNYDNDDKDDNYDNYNSDDNNDKDDNDDRGCAAVDKGRGMLQRVVVLGESEMAATHSSPSHPLNQPLLLIP